MLVRSSYSYSFKRLALAFVYCHCKTKNNRRLNLEGNAELLGITRMLGIMTSWPSYLPCDVTYMWPDLRKAGFHAHNSKTHFSPSNNSCTRWLTIQPGIDAESCPGCFCCGLFLRLDRRPRVYGSPSNGCISPWQADSWL